MCISYWQKRHIAHFVNVHYGGLVCIYIQAFDWAYTMGFATRTAIKDLEYGEMRTSEMHQTCVSPLHFAKGFSDLLSSVWMIVLCIVLGDSRSD